MGQIAIFPTSNNSPPTVVGGLLRLTGIWKVEEMAL
jgi:hypothetical protein